MVCALQEQQQLIEEENRALVQQLMSLNQGATSIETTMRELATLNQMFSGQVQFSPDISTNILGADVLEHCSGLGDGGTATHF